MSPGSGSRRASRHLNVVLGLLVWRIRDRVSHGSLSLSEISALARLAAGGQMTAADLARAEAITPQSMGTTIATLAARGLVRRQADADDRRRSVLSLTPAGRRALAGQGDASVQQMAAVLEDRFTTEEIDDLVRVTPLLERLARAL